MRFARLARNTALLFARQLLVLVINLYAVSEVVSALGLSDFGLFSVIVSVVTVVAFLPGALSAVTQRYFAFAIGNGDPTHLKRIHDASLALYGGAILLSVLGLETLGTWFVASELQIDADRMAAAQVLFQFTVVSFCLSSMSGFYFSIMMAHEDMHLFATFSVLDAVLRLAAVVSLSFLTGDVMIHYGALLCLSAFIMLALSWGYSSRRYKECRAGGTRISISILREMVTFVGWTVFGQLTTVARTQAITILINQAFNPITVAARALAVTVSSQALSFSANFSAALHPPIIKSYAADAGDSTYELVYFGSKITFYFVWLATLPLIVFAPSVFRIWLDTYPEDAILFTRLGLIENAIMAVSVPLMTLVRATGRVQFYELSLGFLQLTILLGSWIMITSGHPPYSVYVVAIVINIVMFFVRLQIAKNLTGLPLGSYFRFVVVPISAVVASSTVPLVPIFLFSSQNSSTRSDFDLAVVALTCLLPVLTVYSVGLSRAEKHTLHRLAREVVARTRGKK